jgi:hypothetical protein
MKVVVLRLSNSYASDGELLTLGQGRFFSFQSRLEEASL